jgi:hypothetical protein
MSVPEMEWESKVKGMLEAELKRRNVTYADLVGWLADIGVMDNEPNIRNKISRGKFTAVFFVQCLEAIGAQEIRLLRARSFYSPAPYSRLQSIGLARNSDIKKVAA